MSNELFPGLTQPKVDLSALSPGAPPLICRIFGHHWRFSHMLASGTTLEKPVWIYHAHTCTRCWTEVKRDLWTR